MQRKYFNACVLLPDDKGKIMNTIEMHGLITGKCVAGDMKVNESVAEYLVRKIANIEDQRNAALNTCTLIGEALGIKGAVAGDTIAKVHQLVGENAVLTDKAASELSNAWLLHKYWVGIQAALMHMHVGRINEATEWLIGTVSGPGIEAPNLKLTDEIEDWAEIQQKDTISHAQALEIIKAEMSASTQAISEIKTQSRIESTYFTANRLLAAFEHGFIDKQEKEVADIALMILESAKYMPSAQPEEFTKTYSDQVLARIAASLRDKHEIKS